MGTTICCLLTGTLCTIPKREVHRLIVRHWEGGQILKVPWTGNKCILCLRENNLSEEHLIPEALGGQLTCEFLCVCCNSRLGYNLEANAKSDPSILMAAKILRDKIPVLAAPLIESHPHVAYSEPGPAQGYIKNGEFRAKSRKLDGGSLIQPTDVGRKTLLRLLRKSGYQEAPARKAVSSFDEAPENDRVEIAPGLGAVKWRIDRLDVDMSRTQIMDPLIPAKAAFEFLCCHVGSAIYDEGLHLSQIRSSIINKQMNPDVLRVERLTSNKYEPLHGICFEVEHRGRWFKVNLFLTPVIPPRGLDHAPPRTP